MYGLYRALYKKRPPYDARAVNDSFVEDTFEEQLKSEINMADILDKIPVDPVVVFNPDDEGKSLMLKKV